MLPIDWEEIAWDNDFKGNDKEMLISLHHIQKKNTREMSTILQVSYESIRKQMNFHNIPINKHKPTSYSPRPPRQYKKGV